LVFVSSLNTKITCDNNLLIGRLIQHDGKVSRTLPPCK